MGLHTFRAGAGEIDFYGRYFGQLVGAEIISFEMVQDEHESYIWWPTFKVRLRDPNGNGFLKYRDEETGEVTDIFEIALSQDEEGNDSGFVFGLPSVAPATA